MDTFLEKRNLLKLKQEEMENSNSPVSAKSIGYLIKNPSLKFVGPGYFTDEFYQIFKVETIPVSHRLFQKIDKGTLPHSSCG